jgi:hypothetical protein
MIDKILLSEITNELINLGYVPDCTNTELENEFEVQDIVRKILKV